MRKGILLLAILLWLCPLWAQNRLSDSRTDGPLTEVYRLTDQETEQLVQRPQQATAAFLHTLADRYDTQKGTAKSLPFGNYLSLKASGNQLYYTLIANGNIRLSFINNQKEFQFTITDLAGVPVTDARVLTPHGKRVRYQKKAHLYTGRYPKKDGYLKIVYKGVTNYFTFETDDRARTGSYHKRRGILFPVKQLRKLFTRPKPAPKSYNSFFVFSKPIYKPYDTVKFKAYILGDDKTPYRPLEVRLNGPFGGKNLALLEPYRDGGYEYRFVLTDSLQLVLDRPYTIQLIDSSDGAAITRASGSFRYEEYELKSLRFNARTNKNMHYPGEPAILFLKAVDENDLTVPDARVEVTVRTQAVTAYYKDSVFVPDTLWKTSLNLDPVGETLLSLPDSIFPAAQLSCTIHLKMLNSNNEIRTSQLNLNFDAQRKKEQGTIEARFAGDSLYIEYREDSVSKPATGWLYTRAGEQLIDSQRVQLPRALPLNYQAVDYDVVLDNGIRAKKSPYQFSDGLEVAAVHTQKQLYLAVANQHKIPFWYTVFSGNKVLLKGYGTALDTVIRHSSRQAAHFRINYFWDHEEKQKEVSSFYNTQALAVNLIAPDVVYPGQQVRMQVAVTDADHKPVPGVDVTAYAHTAKFNAPPPRVPYFGPAFQPRALRTFEFESEEAKANGNIPMDWQKWSRQLGLDTIEYYRFTNPRSLYLLVTPAQDSITQFVPFVVKDGAIDPVSIIYVDEVPVYFEQAGQLQHYAFRITPGHHSIRLRTPEHEIWFREFYFKKGMRTLFSVLADTLNTQAGITRLKNVLSPVERDRLHPYFLRVENNFNSRQAFIRYDSTRLLLNPPGIYDRRLADVLVGPVRTNRLFFQSGLIDQTFLKEPGFVYRFTIGLIRQKSYPGLYTFDTTLSGNNALSRNYRQQVLRDQDIDQLWTDYYDLRSRTTQLFAVRTPIPKGDATGRLRFYLDTAFTNRLPYIKNIVVTDPLRPHFLQVYSGATTECTSLSPGYYNLLFLLKDNRYFKVEGVQVRSDGTSYYSWQSFTIRAADPFTLLLDQHIKDVEAPGYYLQPVPGDIIRLFNKSYFDPAGLNQEITGTVVSQTGNPIAGATVEIAGLDQRLGTVTDDRGWFKLKMTSGSLITVSMVGYITKSVEAFTKKNDTIVLDRSGAQLNEVVVVAYGTQYRRSVTGAVATIESNDLSNALAGRVAGMAPGNSNRMMIRGSGTLQGEKPLIIVDGLPFSGDIQALNPGDIENMNILKDAAAVAIYGAKAASGVVIVKTKKGNTISNEAGVLQEGTQTLRTRFSDEGFWQPRLVTDEQGQASFTVTFPDDITSWSTRLIAVTARRQSGYLERSIRSFKTLSANFVSPLFAVDGDSMNVIGKLMNYTPLPEKLVRHFKYGDTTLRNSALTVSHAHLDTVMIAAKGTDSLRFEYTLQQANGYFDGERRSIPLYPAGVKETLGWFSVLPGDTTVQYRFEPDKGIGTLRAETSVFPVLLDEMKRLRDYEYLCNEQLASKLKSLLLEKKLRAYLKEPFPYEKNIQVVLKKLNENKSLDGLWGWWQGTQVEPWISLHVVEALLEAQQQGYTVQLNKDLLYRYLQARVADQGAGANPKLVRLLARLNGGQVIRDWVQLKEADTAYQKQKKSLYEYLEFLDLKQQAGLKINLDSLLKLHKQTMFGGMYWGEEAWRFWNNSIQNTLLMYQVLRRSGGHGPELSRIRQYFLEQRKDGQWRNTYESSLILETILPELFNSSQKPRPAAIAINNTRFEKFPIELQYAAGTTLGIKKEGDLPVFLTAYQQYQNPAPQPVSKDFTVTSKLMQEGRETTILKAGKAGLLRVEVTARADADYVMIEVPIPAGCSYDSKPQQFWGVETHREYLKNKTAIFCTKMRQGHYVFEIMLMPRYTGSYFLNPAKAELMYFPVFYGREGMKKVVIE
ncbi:alpha-2-macroglobulin family protein [Niabella hirudinis]|uniref:alpha-2-macroglobulin family protein n=1 Tax=Niabella hirudinis TaxID=1285929 RepID=UPI003EBBE5E2